MLDLAAAEADVAAVLARWADAPKADFAPRRLSVNGVTEGPDIIVPPEALAPHLDGLFDRFWPKVPVHTPEMGPGSKGPAVVYGTPSDALVAELYAARGLEMDGTSLVLPDGAVIEGPALRVIFAVEHEGRPWAVYSALDPADLEGIHALFHGPHAITVGRSDDVLAER